MEIEGNLEAMDLPTLIQFVGQDGNTAIVQINSELGDGLIYLDAGLLCHAEVSRDDKSVVEGEDAVFELLTWKEGRFKLQKEVELPQLTMQQPWDMLLMEGLRRLDEAEFNRLETAQADNLSTSKNVLAEDPLSTNAPSKELNKMANLQDTLNGIMNIAGAKAAALVDWESGLTLGTVGSGFDIDLAAAGNTNVVRSKLEVMKSLKIKGGIEDILITLTDQYHMIRLMDSNPNLFIYVALDRSSSNLGMARHQLSALEKELSI